MTSMEISPVAKTDLILHCPVRQALAATIVPLDIQNSKLFSDWDLEEWEILNKLEWYRRPFVQDLVSRQAGGLEKTFLVLTRLVDFPGLLSQCIGRQAPVGRHGLPYQTQAALTVEIQEGESTTIYNIETAPWNKFGPGQRFVSLPAAALFYFAAWHHLTCGRKRFILSHPTEDGVMFYQEKLGLELRWSRGPNRYAVVDRGSLERSLLAYSKSRSRLRQTLPKKTPLRLGGEF